MIDNFCKITEALAAMIASIAAVFTAVAAWTVSRPLTEKLKTTFFSYDTNEDISELFKKAKNDIWIVVNYGDKLLEKYEKDFKNCLERGIYIHYVMLDDTNIQTIEKYTGKEVNTAAVAFSVEKLKDLHKKYKDYLVVKRFHNIITQSYIGIDIYETDSNNPWLESSIIKVMLYQYQVPTKEAASTFMYPKKDGKNFKTTVESIKKIWNEAEIFDLEHYD